MKNKWFWSEVFLAFIWVLGVACISFGICMVIAMCMAVPGFGLVLGLFLGLVLGSAAAVFGLCALGVWARDRWL